MGFPRPIPGIVAQEVEEGLLLLRDDGNYLLINQTAARIWKYYSTSGDIKETALLLTEEPGAPGYDESLLHVETLLKELVRGGFMED